MGTADSSAGRAYLEALQQGRGQGRLRSNFSESVCRLARGSGIVFRMGGELKERLGLS